MNVSGDSVVLAVVSAMVAWLLVWGVRQARRLGGPLTRLVLRFDATGRDILGDRDVGTFDPADARDYWKKDPFGAVQGFTFLAVMVAVVLVWWWHG